MSRWAAPYWAGIKRRREEVEACLKRVMDELDRLSSQDSLISRKEIRRIVESMLEVSRPEEIDWDLVAGVISSYRKGWFRVLLSKLDRIFSEDSSCGEESVREPPRLAKIVVYLLLLSPLILLGLVLVVNLLIWWGP